MSPHVSDDELSVAGGVELPAAADAPAPKQPRSTTRPGPQAKRSAPEAVEPIPSIFHDDDDGKLLSDMRTRSREQHMSLSPPTSSGQMSPASVCTATAYAYCQAGMSWSQPSAAACQRADTATVQSPARTNAHPAQPSSGAAGQAAKASSFAQHDKTATGASHTMIFPAMKEARPDAGCRAFGDVPSGSAGLPSTDTKSHANASSSRSKRPRVRNRATAVRVFDMPIPLSCFFLPSRASSACTCSLQHSATENHGSAICFGYLCACSFPVVPARSLLSL